ncbi:MAG TPA: hypothetical protein VKU92_11660 [Acidimicrobiales bacterium]|nr:hypothetical protein [Acidimicrobiales bacterium]
MTLRHTLVRLVAAGGLLGLLVSTLPQGAGQAAASTTPSVTLAVHSHMPVVTNDVWVIYDDHSYANARLIVRFAGAPAGSSVKVTASRFPFTSRPSVIGTKAVSSSGKVVFVAQPSLETRYRAVLLKGTHVLAHAGVRTVYVTPGGSISPSTAPSCSRPVCLLSFEITDKMVPSAVKTEIGKHRYVYFALNLNPTTEPPPPTELKLVTPYELGAIQRVSSSTYRFSLKFRFRIGSEGYYWSWNLCTKDTVTKDGLGLPGSHSCGDTTIPANVKYLG